MALYCEKCNHQMIPDLYTHSISCSNEKCGYGMHHWEQLYDLILNLENRVTLLTTKVYGGNTTPPLNDTSRITKFTDTENYKELREKYGNRRNSTVEDSKKPQEESVKNTVGLDNIDSDDSNDIIINTTIITSVI